MGGGRERLFIFSTFLVLVLVLVAFLAPEKSVSGISVKPYYFSLGGGLPCGYVESVVPQCFASNSSCR